MIGKSQANAAADIETQACIIRLWKRCAERLTRQQPHHDATPIPTLMDRFDCTAKTAIACGLSGNNLQTFGVEGNSYGCFRKSDTTIWLVAIDRFRSQVQEQIVFAVKRKTFTFRAKCAGKQIVNRAAKELPVQQRDDTIGQRFSLA